MITLLFVLVSFKFFRGTIKKRSQRVMCECIAYYLWDRDQSSCITSSNSKITKGRFVMEVGSTNDWLPDSNMLRSGGGCQARFWMKKVSHILQHLPVHSNSRKSPQVKVHNELNVLKLHRSCMQLNAIIRLHSSSLQK